MMENNTMFFAYLSRMKNINRWGIMRNTRYESLQEHSMETAVIAHALALIYNNRCGGDVDANHIAVAALFHDIAEIITGDIPTPVKYGSKELKAAYKKVELEAKNTLVSMLPQDIKQDYLAAMDYDEQEGLFIKAADKISAIIKCTEELNMGNHDFNTAYNTLIESVKAMNFTPANIFMEEFLPAFSLTIDEQKI